VRALTALVMVAMGASALHAEKASSDMLVLDEPMPGPRPPKFPRPPGGAPAQVKAFGAPLVGTTTCRGVANGRTVTGTMTSALVLGDAWLRIDWSWSDGETSSTMVEHRTYDAIAKQWVRILIGPGPVHATQTSLGAQNGAWTWSGDGTATETQRASGRKLELRRDGLVLTCPA
jgi:hypothetical protein